MVVVVQLVRTPDCGSGGRGFKSHHPPKKLKASGFPGAFFDLLKWCQFFKSWFMSRLLMKTLEDVIVLY